MSGQSARQPYLYSRVAQTNRLLYPKVASNQKKTAPSCGLLAFQVAGPSTPAAEVYWQAKRLCDNAQRARKWPGIPCMGLLREGGPSGFGDLGLSRAVELHKHRGLRHASVEGRSQQVRT